MQTWRGMISSDWNECLAPCGPFDFIIHTYPDMGGRLQHIFRQYTRNAITLGEAVLHLSAKLPEPISIHQMDAYLQSAFRIYTGVAKLIRWCRDQDILFMINTTGMIGYFQRIFSAGLLPMVDVLSAHAMVRYPQDTGPAPLVMPLSEIGDKAANTEAAAKEHDIPLDRVIVMGDSGGDGPHFRWGAENGALLVGSMTKTSLAEFCRQAAIGIDVFFGVSYAAGEARRESAEKAVDFMDLVPVIQSFLHRRL